MTEALREYSEQQTSAHHDPFSSFQIGDKSHVSVIPRSLFPDAKDGRGMIGRERIIPIIKANKSATLA